jgi:COP9 signalosome complex subunit 2
MSDDEYSYHYSDEDEEMMDDGNAENAENGSEEEEFEYTDEDQEDEEQGDDIEMNLENTYYNAKGLRDADVKEAVAMFESLIVMEKEHLNGTGTCAADNGNDIGDNGNETVFDPDTKMGQWTYKSLKQMTKIKIGCGEFDEAQTIFKRLLACISSPGLEGVSPNAIEKGVNGMLDRVSSLFLSNNSNSTGTSSVTGMRSGSTSSTRTSTSTQDQASNNSPQDLERLVYDSTLNLFHPTRGTAPCRNERLWFKTNLKYGQLLYENHETYKLQNVIADLLLHNSALQNNDNSSSSSASSSSSTQLMEIYALQIQLHSRLKNNAALREIFQKTMQVQGGIPHPRTLARIQEIGGKMHMASGEYESACTTFFQAFKSYDEAGDVARLRCLKYLVMASMLHASSINPFDSQEVRPYKKDPEIVAMTNLVDAFHNNDIKEFESILKKNHDKIMNDEFIQEYIGDLLKTIRKQVLLQIVRPYTRISLDALSKELNGIPVKDVESLLVPLILDGKLEGRIDQVKGVLVKDVNVGSGGAGSGEGDLAKAQGSGSASGSGSGSGSGSSAANEKNNNNSGNNKVAQLGHDSIGMKSIDAIESLISELETLTSAVVSSAVRGPEKMHAKMMEGLRA